MRTLKTFRGVLCFSPLAGAYRAYVYLALREHGSNREIPLQPYDTIVIHNADGSTVSIDGYIPNYAPDAYVGAEQARLHGAPENLDTATWENIVNSGLTVDLTPRPPLVEDDEAEDGVTFISGTLEPYYEQGMLAVAWAVCDRTKRGHDALFLLENGDHLTVYKPDGVTVRWEGTLSFKRDERYQDYPLGVLPRKLWRRMFLDNLPATVRRKDKRCAAGKKSGKPNTCNRCACNKKDK